MKKNTLTLLAILVTTIMVNAQEITNYRGAFAPAPSRQWTESWTEFNSDNVVYPTPNITINAADSIVTNTTWTANNTYLLNGIIYVSRGATLTIEPGTVIRGTTGTNSSILVARGSKIIAEGTPCKPIVFTSNQPAGNRARGDWGGILLLGSARNNLGTNNLIEGLPNTDARNFHGGTNDDDNSGILKYVRIEYSGFIFSSNNEINSLTMGSVGRGTTLDYIQVSYGLDDSYEWFGGSVDAKHLVAFRSLDDDLDTDNGYSGTVQYALCIKDPNFSDVSQSEGFESDNNNTGVSGFLPKTSAKFFNVTQIGAFRCASNTNGTGVPPAALFLHRRGARVRRNSDLKIQNSILMNNWRGLFIDDAVVSGNPTVPTSTNYNEDSAVFRNNVIAGDFTTVWTGTTYNGTRSLAYETAVTRNIGTNNIYANDSVNTCSLLLDPWNANANLADFRPNAVGAGSILVNPASISNSADLTPLITIDDPLFTAGLSQDFVLNALETGSGTTNGQITITVFKPTGWDITFNPTAISANVNGGTVVTNAAWNFVDNGASVVITSKPGTLIAKSTETALGLVATRKVATPNGTNQSLSVSVAGGGDVKPNNNTTQTNLSAN
jgi:hypothetical protein